MRNITDCSSRLPRVCRKKLRDRNKTESLEKVGQGHPLRKPKIPVVDKVKGGGRRTLQPEAKNFRSFSGINCRN